MARALESGHMFDDVEPGRWFFVEPHRDRVEKEPGGHFGADTTWAAVGDQPSRDVGLAGESL